MTISTDNGENDVSNTGNELGISRTAQEIAMLLALQRKEWQELRKEPKIVLRYINIQEPKSKRKALMVVIGSGDDDIVGNNATLDVYINGLSIDAIVERVALENGKKS